MDRGCFSYLSLGTCHQNPFSHLIQSVTFNLSVQASTPAAQSAITNFPMPAPRKLLNLPGLVTIPLSSDSPIKLKIATTQGCTGPSTSAKLPSHPAWRGGVWCPEHVYQLQQCLAAASNRGRFMLHRGLGLLARAARCRVGRWGPGSWKGVHGAGRGIKEGTPGRPGGGDPGTRL